MAAVSAADAPGSTSKGSPFSIKWRTIRSPGSEMHGMPASET